MESVHENQLGEVLPYQYEPEVRENTGNATDQSDRLRSDVPGNVCNSSIQTVGSAIHSVTSFCC